MCDRDEGVVCDRHSELHRCNSLSAATNATSTSSCSTETASVSVGHSPHRSLITYFLVNSSVAEPVGKRLFQQRRVTYD